ncbi:MAG: MATE family efflux transporter [Clostridia bacterium]|nr:MATE family efflux transporter [Clostridia bacterium]
MGKKAEIKLSDHFNYTRLIRFTLPTIAMMIFNSIYTVVDGFFVSNFAGKTPFAAVNFIMPVLGILGTVGFIFGTGGTAIVAKTYGEGKKEKANEYFSLFVAVAFITGIVISILGLIFIKPFAEFLGASGKLLDDSVLYASISFISMPFFILEVMFQNFFIAAEKPKLGLRVTVICGVNNMVLDAILCTTLPVEYRLMGAAFATVVSEILGGSIPIIYFIRKNDSILRLKKPKFNGKILLKALFNGSSEFMSSISMSVVGMLYNVQLLKYAGEDGVAAYGVILYIGTIFFGVFAGYSMGSTPIVSYHFGADNHAEMRNLLKKSLIIIGTLGVSICLLSEIFASPMAEIFVGYDSDVKELTISGFRIFALCFLFSGFAIYISDFFTALNDGITSAIISFLRTLLFEGASVMLLPLIFGIKGIWFATVAGEIMAIILGSIFLIAKRKRFNY